MAQRVTQDANLVVAEGSPKARVTQDATLAVAEGSPTARVTQVAWLVVMDAAINPSQITPIIFCSS